MIRKSLLTLTLASIAPSLHGVTDVKDEATLKSHIDGDKPVVVKFYADWCGPCKALAPVFDKIADDNSGKATFLKVESDLPFVQSYNVTSLPTVVFFKNGKEVSRLTGGRKREVYERELAGITGEKVATKMYTTEEQPKVTKKRKKPAKRSMRKKEKYASYEGEYEKSCKSCGGCSGCK